ncbi:hypothetical protein J4434_07400 [Candidatus Woesearchaeota archaeon]|nr:hypothetical protein [Candidatus Woesearchaeota archaeon]
MNYIKKELLVKLLLIILLTVLLSLLISCSNNSNSNYNYNKDVYQNSGVTTNIPVIKDASLVSASQNMIVYEIETDKKGASMQTYEIESNQYDSFKAWQEKQKIKEELDKYNTMKSIWDEEKKKKNNGEYWSEEDRIKEYCKENGYLKCITITETCLKDGCHKVAITCEDEKFNPENLMWDDYDKDEECKKYDIVVEKDAFKKE